MEELERGSPRSPGSGLRSTPESPVALPSVPASEAAGPPLYCGRDTMEDTGDLWLGICGSCDAEYNIRDEDLRRVYPDVSDVFDVGKFSATCDVCHAVVHMFLQHVEVIPFSAMQVLPPVAGCPECGREHDPQLPHDLHALVYQYQFRSRQAQAGREERWPTWDDAMAHCTPDIQQRWRDGLQRVRQGVDSLRQEGEAYGPA